MPITFAAAGSHAPGMTAWADAAPPNQKEVLYGAYGQLRDKLARSGSRSADRADLRALGEFLSSTISARFASGAAKALAGPIEPWLKVEKSQGEGRPGTGAAKSWRRAMTAALSRIIPTNWNSITAPWCRCIF